MTEIKLELENRAKAVQQMLRDEGYGAKTPQFDEDTNTWDLLAKYEGNPVLIMFDVDDPTFVRMLMPNFWDVEPETLGPVLIAMDIANKTIKGAKVHMNQDRTVVSACMEFLYDGSGLNGEMVARCMGMVASAAKTFVKTVREAQ